MNNDSVLLVMIALIIWSCISGMSIMKRLDLIIKLLTDREATTPKASKVLFYIAGKEVVDMEVMNVGKKKKVSVKFVDASGFEAKVDGKPVFAVSDLEMASLAVSEDGMSAEVMALKPGSFMLSLTADADMGAGIKPIIGSLSFDVLSGEAVAVMLVAEDVAEAVVETPVETPVEQPAPEVLAPAVEPAPVVEGTPV